MSTATWRSHWPLANRFAHNSEAKPDRGHHPQVRANVKVNFETRSRSTEKERFARARVWDEFPHCYCCLMVADGALNFSSLPPGTTTLAGVQSLVEVLSEVQ